MEQVAEERSLSTFFNMLVPYYAPQIVYMNCMARRHAFVTPTSFWHSIQLPEGALIELPGVVAHVPSQLRRRESGWWVVAYSEYAARVAAFILGEVYDSLLLWRAPPELITLIRSLDLTFVLGNEENVAELHGLLRIIANTDYRYHEPAQRLRLAHNRASQAETADFLYYESWKGQVLSHGEYVAMHTRGRVQMTVGHPSGFN